MYACVQCVHSSVIACMLVLRTRRSHAGVATTAACPASPTPGHKHHSVLGGIKGISQLCPTTRPLFLCNVCMHVGHMFAHGRMRVAARRFFHWYHPYTLPTASFVPVGAYPHWSISAFSGAYTPPDPAGPAELGRVATRRAAGRARAGGGVANARFPLREAAEAGGGGHEERPLFLLLYAGTCGVGGRLLKAR